MEYQCVMVPEICSTKDVARVWSSSNLTPQVLQADIVLHSLHKLSGNKQPQCSYLTDEDAIPASDSTMSFDTMVVTLFIPFAANSKTLCWHGPSLGSAPVACTRFPADSGTECFLEFAHPMHLVILHNMIHRRGHEIYNKRFIGNIFSTKHSKVDKVFQTL